MIHLLVAQPGLSCQTWLLKASLQDFSSVSASVLVCPFSESRLYLLPLSFASSRVCLPCCAPPAWPLATACLSHTMLCPLSLLLCNDSQGQIDLVFLLSPRNFHAQYN